MSSRLGKRVSSNCGLAVVALAVFAVLLLPAMASAQSDELPDLKPEVKCHGDLKVYTYAYENGVQVKIPAGGGWTLYQNNSQYATEDNAGEDSGDLRTFNYIPGDKTYKVVGWDVSGWKISYYSSDYGSWGHNTTYLTNNDTDTLKVKYTRCTGILKVITEAYDINNSAVNIPTGGGYDLSGEMTDDVSTAGQASGYTKTYNPAPYGYYKVVGKPVTGWTISYDPQDGTLGASPAPATVTPETLELKIIYRRDSGKLIVKTQLTGGGTLPSGSGWNMTDYPADYSGLKTKNTGGETSVHTQTIDPAETGNYEVTGIAVTGYTITYDPQSGTLNKNGTLTLKVIYTEDTPEPATLIIDIEPNGGVTGGFYTVTGPAGFVTLNNQTADQSITIDDSATKPFGTYTVTFADASGYSETVTVEQGDFTGGALSKSGSVDEGETHEIKGVYEESPPEPASLIIDIEPNGGVPGGTYSVSGPAGFTTLTGQTADQTLTIDDSANYPFGTYTVTFTDAAGYSETVTVEQGDFTGASLARTGSVDEGETHEIKGVYTEIPPNNHNVDAIYWDPTVPGQVAGGTITPAGTQIVADGGSQGFDATTLPSGYQLTGGHAFTGSGTSSALGITYTASNVTSDGTLRIYVELIPGGPGELEVIILPVEVRSLGARWKYKNTASLRTSGEIDTLDPGFYDIEATDVAEWITPGARNGVQVFSGQRTTITLIYGQEVTGALQVFITDNVDDRVRKNLGAKWQPIYPPSFGIPNDPNKWYNHGDKITGLPVGELGLRFKTINGWILPELTGAEIFANKTTKETGRYWRVLIIHKSDYNGDGTDDLAVFNKGKRQWQVASISKPAGSPAATYTLMEKKFGKSDDIPTTGDYDGDGIADLAYWRETTGEWNVYKQFKLKNFGEMHDIPVPGDYDADGITDPAIFRPSTGEWFIYNRELEEITTVNFGAAGYVPVPGNYDADEAGRTDLGIFHIESQQWRVAFWNAKKEQWVEKKKIRVAGRKIKLRDNFGAIGNVPVMADYDGDGATDLAVYKRRPSIYDVRDQFTIQLGEHLDIPVPNDWAGLGRVIPTIFNVKKGRWISVDDLLNAKHGKGGQPLMSGR